MTATPLIVFAHADEAECFAEAGMPHLVTGVGKINATLSLAEALLAAEPGSISRVIVLGTAGAVDPASPRVAAPAPCADSVDIDWASDGSDDTD